MLIFLFCGSWCKQMFCDRHARHFVNRRQVQKNRLLTPDFLSSQVIVHATSNMCALEVGGGPWWQTWKKTARYEEPVRSLIDLPLGNVLQAIPPNLQPPGL